MFELTCALSAYPSVPEFVELQKQLGRAMDAEATVLALLGGQTSDETLAQMGPRYGIHAGEALGVPMAAMKRIARSSSASGRG